MYPTFEEIKLLHQKYAPSEKVFNLVFTHCQIVTEIAEQIMQQKKLQINKNLVIAGTLLHDIGVYPFIDQDGMFSGENYITHGFTGAELLRKEQLPEDLCLIVERHAGSGLAEKDVLAEKLSIPAKNYYPQTVEEKLVFYADKFHSKHPRFNTFESHCRNIAKFGEDKIVFFKTLAEEFGIPDLSELAKKYHHPII